MMVKRPDSWRILIVDDEKGFRSLLLWKLRKLQMDVYTASNGEEAVRLLTTQTFDLVVTDLAMPKMQGLAVLEAVKQLAPKTQVIILTGFATIETAVHAVKRGAFDFILKPFDLQILLKSIHRALVLSRE